MSLRKLCGNSRARVVVRAIPLLFLALATLRCGDGSSEDARPGGPGGPVVVPANFSNQSLIIPMDTKVGDATRAPYDQNNGMWLAYGLVNRLLQNGIPV